ncbi:hypothetical protein BgiMline_006558, partial [Biomphalaria glabrata]
MSTYDIVSQKLRQSSADDSIYCYDDRGFESCQPSFLCEFLKSSLVLNDLADLKAMGIVTSLV